jgi:hypothetical protein
MALSAAERRSKPSSDFALPGKGTGPEGKGSGSYLIDTKKRARNALARGAQHASGGELATIKRKVKARFPSIKVANHNCGGVAHHSDGGCAHDG